MIDSKGLPLRLRLLISSLVLVVLGMTGTFASLGAESSDSPGFAAARGTPVRFHSTSPQAVNPIFEGGFRIDLPNPAAAGRNNRFGQGVYLSDSPAAALAERPGGVVLSVDVNLGRNLNILNRGPITDPAMAKAIERGARKHGYDSITTQSVRPGGGVNNVIFDPANAQPRAILLE